MESDESIDLVDSEAVNVYGSVVAKEERENLASISKKVKMLIHHVFIHSSIFFNWSLPSLLNRTKGQLKFPARGEALCARKSDRGCFPCKVANKNCNANCQCRWRSCNEVTRRPAVGHSLKIIKRPAVRYFSIFLFEIQKIFIRKRSTFIYNPQTLPGKPKISNLMFLANLVYRVRSHPSAWHLGTFQWHGWTRSSNNSIFLFEIYQIFLGKYSTFICNPQALLESEKIRTLSVSPTLYTEYEEIQR